MKGPGYKMAPPLRVLGLSHRNRWEIFKNLLLQNHLPKMLEIRYVALPSGLYKVCSNQGLRIQHGPTPGAPVFKK